MLGAIDRGASVLDFGKIRGDTPDGQRGAFEELVCQLARRSQTAVANFRRIAGAGGDGGVECIHDHPTGGLVGYQAKYYTSPSDIDWSAIDKSVATALRTHPDLDRYVIAVACDFTGTRRVKGGKKSDGTWGEWEVRVKKWHAAARKGSKIEFVPWTAHDLRNRLIQPDAIGLRTYWFSEIEISHDWLVSQLGQAVAALDDRYHPEDHVNVEAQSLFEFVARHPNAVKQIREHIRASSELSLDSLDASEKERLPAAPLKRIETSLERLRGHEADVSSPVWQSWNTEAWQLSVGEVVEGLSELRPMIWKRLEEVKGSEDKSLEYRLNRVSSDLSDLYHALEHFVEVLDGAYVAAEHHRTAIVEGRAGAGKSHLLARMAEIALSERRPAILILGQQLTDQPLWPQILQRLGLGNISAQQFLAAMDASAEAAQVRGLILVDAINEGPGPRLWKNELASFITLVQQYPNLACVLSCRSEYLDYVIPAAVRNAIPRVTIRGFESPHELAHASRVYLDKRGITRPVTPWLAPEFTNPLFLRSCCNALKREGKTEFPRGLTGTKAIFAFFIDSVARHLGAGRDGSNELTGPTKEALCRIAAVMAEDRRDYVLRRRAEVIVRETFLPYEAPAGTSWLEVLQRNGLLRFDPDPSADQANPLRYVPDVVRFSFQRFQDHLMAEALLAHAADMNGVFKENGCLAFVLKGESVSPSWQGLVEALSIQVPERFGVELIDLLPGQKNKWWNKWQVMDAFCESVRWRASNAFYNRTLELFNRLPTHSQNAISLLLELSVSIGHPWNADLIHRNLASRKMAERDAFWTVEMNRVDDGDAHSINRLIDWCLNSQDNNVPREAQRLSSLVLSWCFTLSNRKIRDKATKALTSVLLARPDIFPQLVQSFGDVDDLYVWERILGAAFGACCLDPAHTRLRLYAAEVFKAVFAKGLVPPNLLLRDYARGIVELAAYNTVLPSDVELTKCRPPYKSPIPKFNITEAKLTKVSAKAGGSQIMNSCQFGDFGRYEIDSFVNHFVNVRISNPAPYSEHQLFKRFERDIIASDPVKVTALRDLQAAKFGPVHAAAVEAIRKSGQGHRARKATKATIARWATAISNAEAYLLSLLSQQEKERYYSEALPWLSASAASRVDKDRLDVTGARRWVAKKAYDFGWTKKRFATDSSLYSGRERPVVERIGKKYQWLALDELLARLADNYWLGCRYSDSPQRYDSPIDVGFLRDIDPTVIAPMESVDSDVTVQDSWIFGPRIAPPISSEERVRDWPFLEDPGLVLPRVFHRVDGEGRRWAAMYDHQSVECRYEKADASVHGMRLQEFRFIFTVFVHQKDVTRFVQHLVDKKGIDAMEWDPLDLTDGPYLFETPWRTTWPQNQWQNDLWQIPEDISVAFPVCNYLWESHLDASLREGARQFLPSPWFARQLSLLPNRPDASTYQDRTGNVMFISARREPLGSAVLVDDKMLRAFLKQHDTECVWLFVAERNAWPSGNNDNATWRRTEGVSWVANATPQVVTWIKDTRNTPSRARAKE